MLIFYCSKQREITKHEVIKVAINVINRDTDKVTLGQKIIYPLLLTTQEVLRKSEKRLRVFQIKFISYSCVSTMFLILFCCKIASDYYLLYFFWNKKSIFHNFSNRNLLLNKLVYNLASDRQQHIVPFAMENTYFH